MQKLVIPTSQLSACNISTNRSFSHTSVPNSCLSNICILLMLKFWQRHTKNKRKLTWKIKTYKKDSLLWNILKKNSVIFLKRMKKNCQRNNKRRKTQQISHHWKSQQIIFIINQVFKVIFKSFTIEITSSEKWYHWMYN